MSGFVTSLVAGARSAILTTLAFAAIVALLVLAPLFLLGYGWRLLWDMHVVPVWRRWRGARA